MLIKDKWRWSLASNMLLWKRARSKSWSKSGSKINDKAGFGSENIISDPQHWTNRKSFSKSNKSARVYKKENLDWSKTRKLSWISFNVVDPELFIPDSCQAFHIVPNPVPLAKNVLMKLILKNTVLIKKDRPVFNYLLLNFESTYCCSISRNSPSLACLPDPSGSRTIIFSHLNYLE